MIHLDVELTDTAAADVLHAIERPWRPGMATVGELLPGVVADLLRRTHEHRTEVRA